MNMRQHKRNIIAAMTGSLFGGKTVPQYLRFFDEVAAPEMLLDRKIALQALVEELPSVAPEFRCVKVNGGDLVDTFQTRSEALALVLKHARGRKAKLQVVNSETGEIELFAEEEMA